MYWPFGWDNRLFNFLFVLQIDGRRWALLFEMKVDEFLCNQLNTVDHHSSCRLSLSVLYVDCRSSDFMHNNIQKWSNRLEVCENWNLLILTLPCCACPIHTETASATPVNILTSSRNHMVRSKSDAVKAIKIVNGFGYANLNRWMG